MNIEYFHKFTLWQSVELSNATSSLALLSCDNNNNKVTTITKLQQQITNEEGQSYNYVFSENVNIRKLKFFRSFLCHKLRDLWFAKLSMIFFLNMGNKKYKDTENHN